MAATKTDIVDELFDAAYKVNQEQEQLNDRRNGVRNSLRSLKSAGVLTAEQVKEVDELYPVITRTRKNGDDPGNASE